MKTALFTNLQYFFPLVKWSVRVLAPSKARNRLTARNSLNMHVQQPLNCTCAVAVYFLNATKTRVVYNKSIIWWLRRQYGWTLHSCAVFSLACGLWKYGRTRAISSHIYLLTYQIIYMYVQQTHTCTHTHTPTTHTHTHTHTDPSSCSSWILFFFSLTGSSWAATFLRWAGLNSSCVRNNNHMHTNKHLHYKVS